MTDLDFSLNIFNYLKSGIENANVGREVNLIEKLFTDIADTPYRKAFLQATFDYVSFLKGEDFEVDKTLVLPNITYSESVCSYACATGDDSVYSTVWSETPVPYRYYNIATKGLSSIC